MDTHTHSIDTLVHGIKSITTDYDEYQEYSELTENVNLKIAGLEELRLTYERYSRYIKEIQVWNIETIDANYIKDLIVNFINDTKKYIYKNEKKNDSIWLSKYIGIMKKIDIELKNVIDNIKLSDESKIQQDEYKCDCNEYNESDIMN